MLATKSSGGNRLARACQLLTEGSRKSRDGSARWIELLHTITIALAPSATRLMTFGHLLQKKRCPRHKKSAAHPPNRRGRAPEQPAAARPTSRRQREQGDFKGAISFAPGTSADTRNRWLPRASAPSCIEYATTVPEENRSKSWWKRQSITFVPGSLRIMVVDNPLQSVARNSRSPSGLSSQQATDVHEKQHFGEVPESMGAKGRAVPATSPSVQAPDSSGDNCINFSHGSTPMHPPNKHRPFATHPTGSWK